eukprot:Sro1296_g260410.3  (235) ;mRNA; r:24871-26253
MTKSTSPILASGVDSRRYPDVIVRWNCRRGRQRIHIFMGEKVSNGLGLRPQGAPGKPSLTSTGRLDSRTSESIANTCAWLTSDNDHGQQVCCFDTAGTDCIDRKWDPSSTVNWAKKVARNSAQRCRVSVRRAIKKVYSGTYCPAPRDCKSLKGCIASETTWADDKNKHVDRRNVDGAPELRIPRNASAARLASISDRIRQCTPRYDDDEIKYVCNDSALLRNHSDDRPHRNCRA